MMQAIKKKVSENLPLTSEEKSYVGKHGVDNNLSSRKLAEKFGIPFRTAARYMSNVSNGISEQSTTGRPRLLTDCDVDELKNLLSPDNPPLSSA